MSAVPKATLGLTLGKNVLKPKISSLCPLKSCLTLWITPVVSILQGQCWTLCQVRIQAPNRSTPAGGRRHSLTLHFINHTWHAHGH